MASEKTPGEFSAFYALYEAEQIAKQGEKHIGEETYGKKQSREGG
jgi:hypothetical protein